MPHRSLVLNIFIKLYTTQATQNHHPIDVYVAQVTRTRHFHQYLCRTGIPYSPSLSGSVWHRLPLLAIAIDIIVAQVSLTHHLPQIICCKATRTKIYIVQVSRILQSLSKPVLQGHSCSLSQSKSCCTGIQYLQSRLKSVLHRPPLLTISINICVAQVSLSITIGVFLIRVVNTRTVITSIPNLVWISALLLVVGHRGTIVLRGQGKITKVKLLNNLEI